MTRKWVKQELKKNRLEEFVTGIIVSAKENKNTVVAGVVAVLVLVLFAGMVIRNRVKENSEAEKVFSYAQSDFERFNYKAAIDKFNQIEKNYSHAVIMPQVLHSKGLAYYNMGDYQNAGKSFKKFLAEYNDNSIANEVMIDLAAVDEKLGDYDSALAQYRAVPSNNYLEPEALSGEARIYEIKKEKDKAGEAYKKILSHYPETFWSDFSRKRLQAMGLLEDRKDIVIPELETGGAGSR